MPTLQFQIRKSALADTRLVSTPQAPLADGQVRVRVLHFAHTANNITYAAFGDAMGYWQFYPAAADAGDAANAAEAADAADATVAPAGENAAAAAAWGCIPVWGFAEVEASRHAEVAVGERLYGYWPMATHALLQPVKASPTGFSDGSPHRAALHAVYNQVLRCAVDPCHTPDSEAAQALLRPLFLTAFLIDDFLADSHFFGSTEGGQRGVMLLSSASSKTAVATAALLAQRSEVEVVGLTSAANVGYCQSLGIYSRVLRYDDLDTVAADVPCIYVDFAGNGALRKAVHTRFARLAHSSAIGGTHVDQLAGGRDMPGPRATLFFAPAQVKKRSADWGPAVLQQRMLDAWRQFRDRATDPAAPWVEVQWHRGAAAVQAAHTEVLAGRGNPRLGHMLSLHEGA